MTKEQFVKVLERTGLSAEQMRKFHNEFEGLYPVEHRNFLQWLGISDVEIGTIVAASKSK